MLENKADSLEKETPHSKVYNPIVGGREQTYYFFTLISEKLADFIIAVTGVRQKLKIGSQCESVLLRCLTPARLIRMKQITSDEALSNQLLRLYHKSSSGLRRVTAIMK